MMIKSSALGALLALLTNIAVAAPCTAGPGCLPLPVDDVGFVAIAGACLAIGIRIAQRKRNR